MPSDQKRLNEVLQHIERIKTGTYPAVVGRDDNYRIVERPWQQLAEPAKLAVLQGSVDWSGVTNRDQAHILLSEVDPGKITDTQRTKLIEMATAEKSYQELLDGASKSTARDGRDEMER
jgi:hypothetical protein